MRAQPAPAPTFQQWFAHSKIVCPLGQPLVVYHGTGADIKKFSNDFAGTRSGVVDEQGAFTFQP